LLNVGKHAIVLAEKHRNNKLKFLEIRFFRNEIMGLEGIWAIFISLTLLYLLTP